MHKSSFIPVRGPWDLSRGPRDTPRFLQGTIVLGTVVLRRAWESQEEKKKETKEGEKVAPAGGVSEV